MGRVKIEIDKTIFLSKIKELEATQSFTNISGLCTAFENTEWAIKNGVTGPVCRSRLKEFNLLDKINTKPGKRGRQPGQVLSDSHKQKLQAGREKSVDESYLKRMKKIVPTRFHNVVEKAAKANKASLLKLKCLSCSDYQTNEIKHCTVIDCPLHSFRPYK